MQHKLLHKLTAKEMMSPQPCGQVESVVAKDTQYRNLALCDREMTPTVPEVQTFSSYAQEHRRGASIDRMGPSRPWWDRMHWRCVCSLCLHSSSLNLAVGRLHHPRDRRWITEPGARPWKLGFHKLFGVRGKRSLPNDPFVQMAIQLNVHLEMPSALKKVPFSISLKKSNLVFLILCYFGKHGFVSPEKRTIFLKKMHILRSIKEGFIAVIILYFWYFVRIVTLHLSPLLADRQQKKKPPKAAVSFSNSSFSLAQRNKRKTDICQHEMFCWSAGMWFGYHSNCPTFLPACQMADKRRNRKKKTLRNADPQLALARSPQQQGIFPGLIC